jgi:hypothetical protein
VRQLGQLLSYLFPYRVEAPRRGGGPVELSKRCPFEPGACLRAACIDGAVAPPVSEHRSREYDDSPRKISAAARSSWTMATYRRVLVSALTLTSLLAASSVWAADPPLPVLDAKNLGLSSDAGILPPVPTIVDADSAALYCRTMEINARGYARWSTGWGWAFGVVAAGAIATGPIIIASEGSTPTTREKVFSLSIPAAGAILGYIASGLFTRAKDHGALAAQASLALNQSTPAAQVTACNAALAAWNTARSESSSSITSAITTQQAAAAPAVTEEKKK